MLYHRQAGSGAPVVLIHGLFGSLENLGAIARILAADFNVYSVDLPNHGRATHSDHMDLAAMAHAIEQWMSAVDLRHAHFVGHSLGGKVAMELALAAPARVDKLVVMDIAPAAYEPRHEDVFAAIEALDPAHIESREQADKVIGEFIREPAVRSFILKNLVRRESHFSWRMNTVDLRRMYPQLIEGNRSGRFEGETLFIKAGESNYIDESHREPIMTRFPSAQLKIVQGAGHWLHAEKPDLVSRMIAKFLREHSRRKNGKTEN